MKFGIPLRKGGPFYGPRGGKYADAAHKIPWKESEAKPSGKVHMETPKAIFGREQSWTIHVTDVGDGKVKVSEHADNGHGPTMPKESLKHFINDIQGKVDLPPHPTNKAIDAVVRGKAKLLGKGDDGVAFQIGDQVVKMSTTVPYHPLNPGHRTPKAAAAMLKDQVDLGNKLADAGVPGMQRSTFVTHGDKGFQIKDYVEIPEKLSQDQLDAAQKSLLAMHAAGYVLHDQVQVGVHKGEVVMFDIGKAGPKDPKDNGYGMHSQVEIDLQQLRDLYRAHGGNYEPLNATPTQKTFEALLKQTNRKWRESASVPELKAALKTLQSLSAELEETHGEGAGNMGFTGYQIEGEIEDREEAEEEGTKKSLSMKQVLDLIKSGGPFYGPRGGKYEDAAHKIPWKERERGRTGVIHVPAKVVTKAVRDLLASVETDEDGKITRIGYDGASTSVTFRNAAGALVTTEIDLVHDPAETYRISGMLGVGGHILPKPYHERKPTNYAKVTVQVPVEYGTKDVTHRWVGAYKSDLAYAVREVVSHELAHASDPAIRRKMLRDRVSVIDPEINFDGYVNQPHEVTAQLQQLERRLTNKWIYRTIRENPTENTPQALFEEWGEHQDKLNPSNLKRVLRAVADIRQAILDGKVRPINKSLQKAGPYMGPRGGMYADPGLKTPWRGTGCKQCSGIGHVVFKQSKIGGGESRSAAPCRKCNKKGKIPMSPQKARALKLPAKPKAKAPSMKRRTRRPTDKQQRLDFKPVEKRQTFLSFEKAARKLHGRRCFRGLLISIEQEKGTYRQWGPEPEHRTLMAYPYGYIRQTEGTDGDHVDVYLGPNEKATHVYVVDQARVGKWHEFDEQKVMLGFDSAEAAKRAYLAHYNDPRFFQAIQAIPVDAFVGMMVNPDNRGDRITKGAAKGGKYIRRVPYTDGKGRKRYRYYYSESSIGRDVKAGETVRLGKHLTQILGIDEETGTITIQVGGGRQRDVTPREWSDLVSKSYGSRHNRWSEKRARSVLNAVKRLVPAKLLEDLEGTTDKERMASLKKRAPQVYERLQASFRRAGVDVHSAKRIVGRVLERRGWDSDARALAIGSVIKKDTGSREIDQLIRASENLSEGHGVGAGHVASAIELRKGDITKKLDGLAKRAEPEQTALQKALDAAKGGDTKSAAKALAASLDAQAMQELLMHLQATPGLKMQEADDSRKLLLEVPSVAPSRAPKSVGSETVLFVADNGQAVALKARYRLREAHEVVASHDPSKGFKKREDYPKDLQERAYHSDQAEQAKVIGNAMRLKPALVVNTNPDAVNGPPMVTPEGHALGGNSRAMSMQKAYADHPEKAAEMKAYLKENAHQFGLTPEDVDAMKSPMLVREMIPPEGGYSHEDKRLLVRQMNESFTQAMDPRTMQVALGRKLDQKTIDTLAADMKEGETLNAFLSSSRSDAFLNRLKTDGVIDSRNANQYRERLSGGKLGRLNEDGKTLVSRILVGRLVGDADTLSNTKASVIKSVALVVPALSRASKTGEAYDLGPSLTLALDAQSRIMNRGNVDLKGGIDDNTWRKAFGDLDDMFDPHPIMNDPLAAKVLETLLKRPGSRQMPAVFNRFADLVSKETIEEQGGLGFKERRSAFDILSMSLEAEMASQTKKSWGLPVLRKGGPYYGPRGGKWADAKHTIPYKEPRTKVLFHSAPAHAMEQIQEDGLKPRQGAGLFNHGAYASHSQGKVFLSDHYGAANTWHGKVEDMLEHHYDEDSKRTAVMLRVKHRKTARDKVGDKDVSGSRETKHTIPPEDIEYHDKKHGWRPLAKWAPGRHSLPKGEEEAHHPGTEAEHIARKRKKEAVQDIQRKKDAAAQHDNFKAGVRAKTLELLQEWGGKSDEERAERARNYKSPIPGVMNPAWQMALGHDTEGKPIPEETLSRLRGLYGVDQTKKSMRFGIPVTAKLIKAGGWERGPRGGSRKRVGGKWVYGKDEPEQSPKAPPLQGGPKGSKGRKEYLDGLARADREIARKENLERIRKKPFLERTAGEQDQIDRDIEKKVERDRAKRASEKAKVAARVNAAVTESVASGTPPMSRKDYKRGMKILASYQRGAGKAGDAMVSLHSRLDDSDPTTRAEAQLAWKAVVQQRSEMLRKDASTVLGDSEGGLDQTIEDTVSKVKDPRAAANKVTKLANRFIRGLMKKGKKRLARSLARFAKALTKALRGKKRKPRTSQDRQRDKQRQGQGQGQGPTDQDIRDDLSNTLKTIRSSKEGDERDGGSGLLTALLSLIQDAGKAVASALLQVLKGADTPERGPERPQTEEEKREEATREAANMTLYGSPLDAAGRAWVSNTPTYLPGKGPKGSTHAEKIAAYKKMVAARKKKRR